MLKNNLYRLGALMYDGDNSSFNRKTTIRKVIESFYYLNGNHFINCNELPIKLKEMFDIQIHIDEICKVIKNNDQFTLLNGSCTPGNHDKCDVKIKLTEYRFRVVKEREEAGSIYKFIDIFYNSRYELSEKICIEDFTSLIENFLYTIYVQNMEKSSKMFDLKLDKKELMDDLEFTEEQKNMINDFLDYDDDKKNKAIFDIGSLALEFVILNGKINIQNQESSILRKILYLDTNIIFRMMGINGEQRKKRVRTLIKRCIETGQEVRISYASQIEFFESIKRHLHKVEDYHTQIHYTAPITDAIIKSYFDSNSGNVKFYEAKLKSQYETTIKELGINYDPLDYNNKASGKERVIIDSHSASLASYKSQREIEIIPDAVNIAHIQNLRKNQGQSFRELKEFFLTSDKHLINWELNKLEHYPIAMYPSNWLSIILKFGSRTTDDYKAFISFIKNVHHEDSKDADTILATLKVISTKAESIEMEKALFDIFIENDYEESKRFNSFDEKEQFAEVKIQEYIDTKFDEFERKEKENYKRMLEMERKQELAERRERLADQREQERIENNKKIRIELIDAQYDGIKAQRDNKKLLYGISFFASIVFMYFIWKDFNWIIDEGGNFKVLTSDGSMGWIFFLSSVDLLLLTPSFVKFKDAISKKSLRSELLIKEITSLEIDDLFKRYDI